MRIAAVAVVVAALLAGALFTSSTTSTRDRRLAAEEERLAVQTAQATGDAVRTRLSTLQDRAGVLASNLTLRAGLSTDQPTLEDLVRHEGLRDLSEYSVYAVRRPVEGSPDHQPIAVLHGLGSTTADALDRQPAAKSALGGTAGNAVVALDGGAALVAFAPVSSIDGFARGYVAIGEALDPKELAGIATDARAALVVAQGNKVVASAGDEALARALAGAAGRAPKKGDLPFVDSEVTVTAHGLTLAPNVVLWAGAAVGPTAEVLRHDATLQLAIGWIVLAILGLGLAAFLFLRSRPKPPAALDAWAGVTGSGAAPNPGQSAPVLVPVMLPNGQLGQLITGSMPGLTSPQFSPVPTPASMSLPAMPLATDPAMFGRYKLLERLGAGGMAEVWIAVAFGAGGFKRPFVVKRILAQHAGNQELVQQFIDEANLGSQLVQANIVPVFDFGNLNGEYYLAQEYVLGRDLGKIVQALAQRGRTIDAGLAAYVTAELLKALDYAHTLTDKQGRPLNVVHRDISPNNVLVSGRGEVKLIDFGIAKSETKVSQTEIGTVKGNVRFMAPEQARGEATDARTDVFSLGASLYFALRGEALYTVSGQYEQLLAAANGPGEIERKKIAELPSPMDALLARALEPVKDQRYPSAQAFLEALLPHVPADGSRRLAALVQELFGEALAAEEQKFAAAAEGQSAAEDATIQRLAPRVRSGIS